MNRHRPLRLPLTGSAGYTLVEVIVAMLISCIMVTAVMGVAVTAKQESGKGMRRMMFDQGIAQISADVKQYVTACGCLKSNGNCSVPAGACTAILGPNSNNAGAATWYINGAPGAVAGVPISDSLGTVWALSCGTHVIKGVLNGNTPNLEAAPYSGTISYTVTYPGGCGAAAPAFNDTPAVTYTANWTEP